MSTNDYTTEEKTKLSNIEPGAEVNAVTSVAGKTGAVTLAAGDMSYSGSGTYSDGTVGKELSSLKTAIAAKPDVDGTYEDLTAGNAEQLLSNEYIEDKVPYLFRQTGGGIDGIGDRLKESIVGGTVAWNQLLENGNFENSRHWNASGCTLSVSDNTAIIQKSIANPSFLYSNFTPVNNHVYCISGYLKGQYSFIGFATDTNATDGSTNRNIPIDSSLTFVSAVVKPTNAIRFVVRNATDGGSDKTFYAKNINLIDLTQMFGTTIADYIYSLEQATAGAGVAKLRSWGFFTEDYYAYDAGSLKSVEGLTSHVARGFNQWDEEWELGSWSYSSGSGVSVNDRIRAKNFIKVVSGANYYLKAPDDGNTYYNYCWYDSDKNYISGLQTRTHLITAPTNAKYLLFSMPTSYGTTYNHDICINLSDPTRNGTYEPYTAHTYALDSDLTLRGIPKLDANNKLYYDGDTYEADGTVTRRYGIVDLGTLTWTRNANTSQFYASLPSGVSDISGSNVRCSKYIHGNAYSGNIDKVVCVYGQTIRVWIVDSAYTDAAAFKTAMSGVYLVYELATPTTESADPYRELQIVDPYGTEEYVSTSIVPVGHESKYPQNLRQKIEDLPWDLSMIAPIENGTTASQAYAQGKYFLHNNQFCKAKTAIAANATFTLGTNYEVTTVAAELFAALS